MKSYAPIRLRDVLHHRFVDTHGLSEIAGYARQTIHNKISDGTLGIEPVGQLDSGMRKNIYLRSDAERLATARRLGVSVSMVGEAIV